MWKRGWRSSPFSVVRLQGATAFGPIGACTYIAGAAVPFEWNFPWLAVGWDAPLTALVLFGLLAAVSGSRERPGADSRFLYAVLGFLLVRGLSVLVSDDIGRSAQLSARMLPALLLFLLIADYFQGPRHVRLLMSSIRHDPDRPIGLPRRSRTVFSRMLLGLVSVVAGVYAANAGFEADLDGVPFKGTRMTAAERALIEKAKRKLEGYGASDNLKKVARCINDLLGPADRSRERINRETGKTANQKYGGTTKDDKRVGCEGDLMNINPRYLVDNETQDALLACTLAHEGQHAIQAVLDKNVSEGYAYAKELECLDFLIATNTGNVKKALEERKKIANKLGREHAKAGKLIDPPTTKFELLWLHGGGEIADEDQRCAFAVAASDPLLFVRQLDVNDPAGLEFPLTVITRPLSLAVVAFGPTTQVFVAGTGSDDTLGLVEVYTAQTEPACGVGEPGVVVFQRRRVIPASVAVDEVTGNLYILDARGPRVFLVQPGRSPRVVARPARVPEMEEIRSIGFGPVSPRLANVTEPQLQGAPWPWSADSFSSGDRVFALLDLGGNARVDEVVGATVQDLVVSAPHFAARPMEGESAALVRGTAGSTFVMVDAGGNILGSLVMPRAEPASMSLSRALVLGESVSLRNITALLDGQIALVSAAQPDILNVEPGSASESGGGSVTITGRNFAADSAVGIGGVAASPVQFAGPTTIIASIPASPVDILPFPHPPETVAVEVLSATAGSAFADFTYYDETEFPFQFDTDGDGVADPGDNCPTVFNPSQQDRNDNDIGDACQRRPPG